MTIEIISRANVIAEVPARWADQYRGYQDGDKELKTMKLAALEKGFSAEDVNSIIGNKSWTELNCHECRKDSEYLVHIGDDYDYDAQYADVCKDCLDKAVSLLAGK